MSSPVTQLPGLAESTVVDFLASVFGLSGQLQPLAGERDQNFLITPSDSNQRWLLKIANAASDRRELELENAVLVALRSSPIAHLIPTLRPSVPGHLMEEIATDSGRFFARVMSYQEGDVLARIHPREPELLKQLGSTLGHLAVALTHFQHPLLTPDLRSDFHWNLDRVEQTLTEYPVPADARFLIDPFLARYADRVRPLHLSLRRSLIHNDANDHNVIVAPAHVRPQQITGLIDFGDMTIASTINELAIALAYVMLDQPDPLRQAAWVVQGFHEVQPLRDEEFEILFDLAVMRLCTSVVLAAHQRSLNPDNEYLSVTDQPARKTLKRLRAIHPEFAAGYFRWVCDQVPLKSVPQLRSWLENNRQQFFPLLGQPLSADDVQTLDLSVSSSDPLAGDLGAGSPESLFRTLQAAGKTVGIGKYLEPRTCYLGDQFAVQHDPSAADDPAEPRTIHMGVDLFVPAGTSVHAPLDGVVQSLADNDIPFDYGPTILLEHTLTEATDSPTFLTLYGHLSRDSLEGLRPGARIRAGEAFARVGDQNENGGWAPHLHFQVMSHDLGLAGNYPGVVRASELELWREIILDPYPFLGLDRERFVHDALPTEQIRKRREQYLNPSLSLSYRQPLHLVRGRGQWMYDHAGRPYLDCVNNVCHVGHCHPHVVQAASDQLARLNTNTRYLHEEIARYAERLANLLPAGLDVCFLVNSGSEANDLALRLARNYTRRHEVICVEAGYHGHVTSLIEVSPYKYNSAGGSGRPAHVHELPLPDAYRGRHRHEHPTGSLAEYYAGFVGQAIRQSAADPESRGNHRIAALICESILSCGGQIVLPDDYLQQAYRQCRAAGILCIADEVQVGFGRVGEAFWGFQTQNVVPDIVTLGKPIGNGFPLGAVVTTRDIADAFHNGMEYFNTFGGSPVAAAVGNAVLDVIQAENLQQNALEVGHYFLDRLRELQQTNPLVGDVRGRGLFLGIELVSDPDRRQPNAELASYLVERMKQRRVLLSTDGPDHNVIKIKPPLCFTRDDVDRVVAGLAAILNESYPRALSKLLPRVAD